MPVPVASGLAGNTAGFESSILRVSNSKEYEYQYQQTGHSMLSVSDFGWWSCKSCKRNGDDWTSPEDFPCTEEIDTSSE